MTTAERESSWTACPPGSLSGLDRRLRGRRRSKLMRESAALILVAAFIGFTAGYFASPATQSSVPAKQFFFAGIGCNEVRSQMPALMQNRLDPATAMRIRQHVMECPECGRLMKQMQSMQSVSKTASEATPADLASSHAHSSGGRSEL